MSFPKLFSNHSYSINFDCHKNASWIVYWELESETVELDLWILTLFGYPITFAHKNPAPQNDHLNSVYENAFLICHSYIKMRNVRDSFAFFKTLAHKHASAHIQTYSHTLSEREFPKQMYTHFRKGKFSSFVIFRLLLMWNPKGCLSLTTEYVGGP